MINYRTYLEPLCKKAKEAARAAANLNTTNKTNVLLTMADLLFKREKEILQENLKDLENARAQKLDPAKIERLTLNRKRIEEMAGGLREVAALPDPVGEILQMERRPNGMQVGRMRVPIGVIAIIYESRPNVTVDSASLCLKSGNAVILKGGSEALHSNQILVNLFSESLKMFGIPEGAVTFINKTDRAVTSELLKMDAYIDLVIPRGGEGLIKAVTESSRIPVIKHDKGLCHIYVDEEADLEMAKKIALNAKIQRPGTCNAMETLLVHQKTAPRLLPDLLEKLSQRGVEIRGCPETLKYGSFVKPAKDADFHTEYLDLILSVKVVSTMDEAMNHIDQYGSRHTESIITENYTRGLRFLNEVDASAVLINASTRLNDGYQFGLGAEIGISTTRIHARGPMGLKELTSMKYVVLGSGQIRE
ncbi:MAG: glutamate-5-semialdehyde dehydrogenase [Nitrospirae bacterium]|nr:glutamate-5-semialdehyde dehydrogenase [Nitrospirota bacterium]